MRNSHFSLQILGMHWTVCKLCSGQERSIACFWGRVIGKFEAFASRAKIVHIDIDFAEIGKNKIPHLSICADIKLALEGLNSILEEKVKKWKVGSIFQPGRRS
ncbi:Acetolactate synthase [Forsythia ovata]|uniref:Acetolactate synthase n=1 Tax=Forsythia ovata TaxID=205694 RepID=A0ABD1U8G8_9LAMI